MRPAVVCSLVLVIAGAGSFAGQERCDRACLESWLDRYMDAFVAHAPSRLRLARGAKFTENGQRLEPGDGTWRTVTGRGGYALKIADVEKGEAVLMGTIREAETPTICSRARRSAGHAVGDVRRS